jgi:hypothetical protein
MLKIFGSAGLGILISSLETGLRELIRSARYSFWILARGKEGGRRRDRGIDDECRYIG